MRLRKIRVKGFQCYSDSGDVEFKDGFNLIIGQNNSGKSALLRAMLPDLPDDRHRNPENWKPFGLPAPSISLTIESSGREIREWILRFNIQLDIPIPTEQFSNAVAYFDELVSAQSLHAHLIRGPGSQFGANYPTLQTFRPSPDGAYRCVTVVPRDGVLQVSPQASSNDSLPSLFEFAWRTEMFYFSAERLTIGEAQHAHSDRLEPNASNLPRVLHYLNGSRGRIFQRLVQHLREIFPNIGNLSVVTKPENQFLEIRLWPTQSMDQRELSFPLNSSGTGVAQAIAILTAVMTVENSVIIIDEINTFLHPAAVKLLMRILRTEYPGNQYIISTHALELIGLCEAETIQLVKRDGYSSVVKSISVENVDSIRLIAQELGFSIADVFAADRVIWVEGPTEELVFPLIYKSFSNETIPRGTIFCSVVATGDFLRSRDRSLVYDVYQRLSSATSVISTSAVFSFDSETLTPRDKEDMERRAGGRIRFLPRRHVECYFIDVTAIHEFIVSKDPSLNGVLTREDVFEALTELASSNAFSIPEWDGSITNENWQAKVDAANLISDLVSKLSDHRVQFQKRKDSLQLAISIINHEPSNLKELFNYIEILVKLSAQ